MRKLSWFFGATRLGRALTTFIHPKIHPNLPHAMRFGGDNPCWLCRVMFAGLPRRAIYEAMQDQSTYTVREPEYDSEGNLTKAGIQMPISVKRQIDAMPEDVRVKLMETMNRIAVEELPKKEN